MNIPTEFNGKIYFYWNTRFDFLITRPGADYAAADDDEYVFVGESQPIRVELLDPRPGIVEALEKQITKERAESQRRIELLQGKIQQMLALECQAEEA